MLGVTLSAVENGRLLMWHFQKDKHCSLNKVKIISPVIFPGNRKTYRGKAFKNNLTPFAPEVGTHCDIVASSPYWFYDRCIFTGRALKLILYDFFSNFIWKM